MNSNKEKIEVREITNLVLQLSPDQRNKLKYGLIIGKTIFKPEKRNETDKDIGGERDGTDKDIAGACISRNYHA